ncbi:Wadjet anti-phage system protein JetD domain-containing protein [Clostridium sp.]|uniref:Wadjet anti-phage system protein JetD domain-containing protein n=1 Tax=Clostridium sp. TaxID=1506 RepID=UPI003D6D5466
MEKFIKLFLQTNCKISKKFELIVLENFIIKKSGGQSNYYENGGYEAFYNGMQKLKQQGIIREISNAASNKDRHPMKLRWSLNNAIVAHSWDDEAIIRLSDILNLNTYIRHPQYQTDVEWQYILNIYSFLKESANREWSSLEERCLELFYDEKFLTVNKGGKKDNKVMKRLGLSAEHIKAKQYGEQFIYWNKGVSNIKTIIILENHSTFFAFKKAVQSGIKIFGIEPDALIFGYGKKIIKGFSFIDEIAIPDEIVVYYFGDMDPEGYYIYGALRERYPAINIKLLVEAYIELMKTCKINYPHEEGQVKRKLYLKYIIDEIKQQSYESYVENVMKLWELNYRIPQELITYEYLLKLKGKR